MTAWTPLLGALVAGVVAWIAIGAVALARGADLALRPLRLFGAAALFALALAVAGLPVPWLVPPSLLALGVVLAVAAPIAR